MTKKKPPIATKALVPVELIERRIYLSRGHNDARQELAEFYQVPTKVFNQAISRDRNRFPADFMFQLTPEDVFPCCCYALSIFQLVWQDKTQEIGTVFSLMCDVISRLG